MGDVIDPTGGPVLPVEDWYGGMCEDACGC